MWKKTGILLTVTMVMLGFNVQAQVQQHKQVQHGVEKKKNTHLQKETIIHRKEHADVNHKKQKQNLISHNSHKTNKEHLRHSQDKSHQQSHLSQ